MTAGGLGRTYAALSALRWLPVGLTVPVLVLLLQARGLDLAATGRLMAVYSAVALLLELPTGGLADVVGRRPVLAASSVASAAGSVLFAVGTGAAVLLPAAVLLGLGRALGSGPLEAWYVDAARADDPSADIRRGLAGGQSAEEAALGIGAVAGGAVPALVAATAAGPAGTGPAPAAVVLPLSVPFLLAAALYAVHALAVVAVLRERRPAGGPSRGRTDSGAVPDAGTASRSGVGASVGATVREGLRLTRGSGAVRRLLAFSAVLGVVLAGIELLSPGHVASLLGGPEAGGAAYGVLVALGFGAGAVGSWLAPRLVPPGRDPRPPAALANLAAAALVGLIGAPVLGVAGAAFVLTYLLLGAGGPLIAEMLHDRVDDGVRSTMLSLESLTLQVGAVLATLAVGGLADRVGTWPALGAVALVLAGGAALLATVPPRPARASG